MARLNDTSGVAHTCPLIDEVIAFVNNIELSEEDGDEFIKLDQVKHICIVMEQIRTANENLRIHGASLQDEVDDKESQISSLEYEIDGLKQEKIHLEGEVESLEGKIEGLEETMYNLQNMGND